jgi:hypothetical protein
VVQYRRAGADELALSFAGPQPAADAAHFRTGCRRRAGGPMRWSATCSGCCGRPTRPSPTGPSRVRHSEEK